MSAKEPARKTDSNAGDQVKRAEFSVRTKFRNELPPPPFPPLRTAYDYDYDSLLNAGALSTVYLQRPLVFELDTNLGVPLDCAYQDLDENVEFSSRDSMLLEEPKVTIQNNLSQSFASQANSASSTTDVATPTGDIGMGTSFLRRTAYMTVETKRQGRKKMHKQSEVNMQAELQKLLNQFEKAKAPLSELRHPTNPKLKAVKAVPLLPDFKNADLQVFDTRFVGSATLQQMPDPPTTEQLEASVLLRQSVADESKDLSEQFITLYAPEPSDESMEGILNLKHDLRDQLPPPEAEKEETQEFILNKVQTANVQDDNVNEIFLTFTEDDALYTPIQTRLNMTRRRLDARKTEALEEFDCQQLSLKMRELTPQESMQRDEVRSIYDPVTYG